MMSLTSSQVDSKLPCLFLASTSNIRSLTVAILREYFFSWRPYTLILARLYEVHGVKRRYIVVECHRVNEEMLLTCPLAQMKLLKTPEFERYTFIIGTSPSI